MHTEKHSSSGSFWRTIDAIEDIVLSDEFQFVQNYLLSTYRTNLCQLEKEERSVAECDDPNSEEQHEYFPIFKAYSQDMAHLLETRLKKILRDEQFDFNQFLEIKLKDFSNRVERGPENDPNNFLESDIFEMLLTVKDFVKFKELYTEYKEMIEGNNPTPKYFRPHLTDNNYYKLLLWSCLILAFLAYTLM